MSPTIDRMDLTTMLENIKAEYRDQRNEALKKQNGVKVLYGEVQHCESGKIYQLEIRILHMNYREKPALALIISDITQRNTIITLQDNHNYKNRLLASVSHELRTPLNASINFTRMAIEDPNVPTNIKDEYLSPSLVSSQLLLFLINDILDFSQISENKLRLVYEKISFKDSFEQCVNLIKLQAARKRIGLEVDYQMDCLTSDFYTDHNRLKQIVLNLLSNALKFTLEGKIKVTAKLDYNQSIYPETDTGACLRKRLHVSVEDTGIGMSPEDRNKLFQAFEKIELGDRVAINSTGVGLGLVISNNLVKMLNHPETTDNFIKVDSEKDVGSRFSFMILEQEDNNSIYAPKLTNDENYDGVMEENLQKDKEDELGTESDMLGLKEIYFRTLSDKQVPGRAKKNYLVSKGIPNCSCPSLLVVDDDIFNVAALESILRHIGYACDTAFNGKKAIEKIVEKSNGQKCGKNCAVGYRAILMDCSMPIMDGFEASKILKGMMGRKEIPETPIVACTAFVQEKEKQRALEAGMIFYLVKPLTREKIKSILQKIEHFSSKLKQ